MRALEAFFKEIDDAWPRSKQRVRLRVIGSTALMLQTSYNRGTKDSDVLETDELTADVKERLRKLAGEGTDVHKRHRLYIDIVSRGLPFRRQVPRCHLHTDLNASLGHFEIEVLSVVDVVVSKLKRFNTNDRSDIDAMVAKNLLTHAELVSCFAEAMDFTMDAKAEELPRYLENLKTVERDMFGVASAEIDLPSWIR